MKMMRYIRPKCRLRSGQPKALPPTVVLRDPAHQVDRRTVGYWRSQVVLCGLAGAATVAGLTVVLVTVGVASRFVASTATFVGAIVLAGTGVAAVILPRWWYRIHRWEVTPTAIYVKSGWVRKVWAVAPVGCLQSVDTVADPLARWFGVAHVIIRTATGHQFVIRGIAADKAVSVSDNLVDLAWADGGCDAS
ncbi:PH domain-containing protein [Rhodococcus qingshengii]|uniref:PH domain-containing protein n=1 Tax=Rhodococcus qingshengii TaxID=334542 RepID=UPI0036DA1E21